MPARSTASLTRRAVLSLFVVAGATAPWVHRSRGNVAGPGLTAAASRTGAAAQEPVADPVTIGPGEAAGSLVVHWDPGPGGTEDDGPGSVDLYDADAVDAPAGTPLAVVPTRGGADGVLLPPLPADMPFEAVVTVTAGGGTRRLGPSAPYTPGPSPTSESDDGLPPPCLGAGYGLGAVAVDGWAGVQGSYCLPPAFAAGTGAFCVDHGLDYPRGDYDWAASEVGEGTALVDQYGRAADPDDVARLGWVLGTYGSTTDPARAVAVGVIVHAVMGDYPGLSVADLWPPHLIVAGGDPAAVEADVGAMWLASGQVGGPYTVALAAAPGIHLAGRNSAASVTVTGRGGGPEAGVVVDLSASTGATVTPAEVTTAADGRADFSFSPTGPAVGLEARVATGLPGDTLELWTPQRPPVAVQRVVTAGVALHPAASMQLSATVPATAVLRKVSTDPAVAIGAGFAFTVALQAPGGWQVVATRTTAPDGSMAPVTGLAPGTYRVTETAAPPALLRGGPWQFSLVAGQQATWTLADAPVQRPLTVVKLGDDTADLPVGGAVFAVEAVAAGGGATPVGTLTTGTTGTTALLPVAPGTYRVTETSPPPGYAPAAPLDVSVPPVGAGGATPVVVTVTDHAVPGTIEVVKTDAATGTDLAGAVVSITRVEAGGGPGGGTSRDVTTGAGPTAVSGLEPGTYRLAEVHAPGGFEPDPRSQQVALGAGQVLQVVFADVPVPPPVVPTTVPKAPAAPVRPRPQHPVVSAGRVPETPVPKTPVPKTPVPTTIVPGAVVTPPGAALAFTGLPLWRWLLAAAGVLGLGGSLVRLARRRP